jgi:hypothetical protein
MRIKAAITAQDRSAWNRWIRLSGATAASAALVAAALPLWPAAPAGAATVGAGVVTLAGSAGTLPAGSATVVVEAELAENINAAGVPQTLEDVPVATQAITTGSFSVPVPASATLAQAEQQGHGNVNFNVVVVSGTHMTSQYVPAPLTPAAAPGNKAALAVVADKVIQVPAFPAYRAASAVQQSALTATPEIIPPAGCTWKAWGSQYQDATRIGEVHVANATGVSDTFEFSNQNDLSITVGLSASDPDGNFSASGTITLTNSLKAGGGTTFPAGTVQYADDDTVYQEYQGDGDTCPGWPLTTPYKIQAVSSEDDVFHGTNTPGVNPWGGCLKDSLHAVLPPHSYWDYDQSKSEYYSGIASWYGFTFGGSDGFTTDVQHDYNSTSSSPTTYICGPKDGLTAPESPILYNTP